MCDQKSIDFKRGSTFAFMFEVPEEVPDGFFRNWSPKAQLRKSRMDTQKGLISELDCYWNDEVKARQVIVRHLNTDHFPLGDAELDIRLESASGETIMTETQLIKIERGITHG